MTGKIVLARDQVFSTCCCPLVCSACTGANSFASTYGRFLVGRLIETAPGLLAVGCWLLGVQVLPTANSQQPTASLPAPDDELAGVLVAAGLFAHRRLAPGRLGLAADRRLALAAAVRMVPRVHRRAADSRPSAQPTTPAGLAQLDRGMLRVTNRADRRGAGDVHPPHLAGR